MSIQDELRAYHIQFVLIQLLNFLVKVSSHLLVLLLEKRDVLERGLLVIKQRTDTRLLLILYHLFLENFKFQLHEVDLLLQVRNVLILHSSVWIRTQSGVS